jgi:type I restriction enzyme M protein
MGRRRAEADLAGKSTGRRDIGKADYQSRGVLYLPEQARFANLLQLPEGENIGKSINDAMAAIEDENPQLAGVLPRTYQEFSNDSLVRLLRSVNSMLGTIQGDAFGKVYEYFLGKFAIAEGQKGGEYFTPTSIVRLIVEIIEPFNGHDASTTNTLLLGTDSSVCAPRAFVSCARSVCIAAAAKSRRQRPV